MSSNCCQLLNLVESFQNATLYPVFELRARDSIFFWILSSHLFCVFITNSDDYIYDYTLASVFDCSCSRRNPNSIISTEFFVEWNNQMWQTSFVEFVILSSIISRCSRNSYVLFSTSRLAFCTNPFDRLQGKYCWTVTAEKRRYYYFDPLNRM